MDYFWLIPFLPLAGFLINGLLQKFTTEKSAGLIGSLAVGSAFALAAVSFFGLLALPAGERVVRHTLF